MKRYLLLFAAVLVLQTSHAQSNSGKVASFFINAKTLQNKGGENAKRKVSVYLPPNYEVGNKRFPVIYYLHGFMGTEGTGWLAGALGELAHAESSTRRRGTRKKRCMNNAAEKENEKYRAGHSRHRTGSGHNLTDIRA